MTDFEAWLEMRSRLLDGLEDIVQVHEDEITTDFEHDAEVQNELMSYKDCEDDVYYEVEYELYSNFSDAWLVQHGYAFFDNIHGILPIKWKDIPREQWGEVPDPTATILI